MGQYQTFPEAKGSSNSVAKLRALRIPVLEDLSFLDVGCNEGFFCGYALFSGAKRAVGIDASKDFIERARKRFPGAEFYCQDWTALPDGQFDVILLSSALHYADDQPALIHRLVDKLAPDGVFILEVGIAAGDSRDWVETKRGSIDTRLFPTKAKLEEILEPYAHRRMGESVGQVSDPNRRFVYHIAKKKPYALVITGDRGAGKSNLARWLTNALSIPVVTGDAELIRQAKDASDPELRAFLRRDLDSQKLSLKYKELFSSQFLSAFLSNISSVSTLRSFALDMYIPDDGASRVCEFFAGKGFHPIHIVVPVASAVRYRRDDENVDRYIERLRDSTKPGGNQVPE